MVQCSLRLAVGEARTTWRHSSVGQSIRFIPEVSPVRIQVPLPFIKFGHCPFPYSNGPVVKRLRLRPFTAATRVRVPSGSPPIFSRSIWRHSSAGRASASHAEGHRFEFCCLHHGNPLEPQGSKGFFLLALHRGLFKITTEIRHFSNFLLFAFPVYIN